MHNKDYESTEFYSHKYENFSTIIIIPMALLVLILVIGSIFAVKQEVITSTGIVEPKTTVSVVNQNYQEGQIITRNNKKWLIHLDNNKPKVAYLIAPIDGKNKVNIVTYFPANEIAAIKKGQTLNLQLPNANGKVDKLAGKVEKIGIYPNELHGKSVYEVVCQARPKKNVRYGMQGTVSIITGKSTYFDYFKNKIFDQR